MNLRWYIQEIDVTNKDDRYAETRIIQRDPILQFMDINGNWKTVPSIIERVKINNERS